MLPVGYTRAQTRVKLGLHFYIIGLILASVLLGAAIWFIGDMQRSSTFARNSMSATSALSIVDSRQGIVLLFEKGDSLNNVVVDRPLQNQWTLISQSDTTASNPTLAPDGSSVAYVSQLARGQIVVASILTNTRQVITSEEIGTENIAATISRLRVCSWTTIAWHPNSNQIAFFGCGENIPISVVIVGDISGSKPVLDIIEQSKSSLMTERQLAWLDDHQLAVTVPVSDTLGGAAITTLQVP